MTNRQFAKRRFSRTFVPWSIARYFVEWDLQPKLRSRWRAVVEWDSQ